MYEQDREVIGCKATYKVKPSKTNPPRTLKEKLSYIVPTPYSKSRKKQTKNT